MNKGTDASTGHICSQICILNVRTNMFTFWGLRQDLSGVAMLPVVLNILSELVLVAQMHSIFVLTWLLAVIFYYYHTTKSRD